MTSCAQRGLPAPDGARFCCYGCELCHQVQTEARDDHARLVGTMSFTLVLSMIVMMLALFLYAEDVFNASGDVEMAWLRGAYRWASFVLATPVLVLAGAPLARRAVLGLRRGRLSMDALILVGALAAYVLSVDAIFRGRHALYFDSATAAVVLATFGRLLEAKARTSACRALGPLLETTRGRVRVCEDGAPPRLVSSHEVEPGMRIEVDPGQIVPVDLRLETEMAELDVSVLTGESRPVRRTRGETLPAGAVPISFAITGTALTRARDSAIDRLARLAASLQARPSTSLVWADRFATALTPSVALVGAATVAFWMRAGSLEKGVIAGLAVVLAACPCTYSIASPLVHWVMLKTAFQRRVLIRSAEVLEELALVRTVAFDKTGTLTRPELVVVGERLAPSANRAEVLSLVRALEEGNPHPFARALVARAKDVSPAPLERRRIVAGRGVEGFDEEGRRLWLAAGGAGATVLDRDGEELAAFELDEEVRPDAREAIDALKKLGVHVVLLSGDDESRVSRVGRDLGIEASARLTPEEKVACIETLGSNTAMVGDGMNDAPALASRKTSFTLGEAAQLPKAIAQVTLLEADLRLVPWTIELGRRAMRMVQSLLIFATGYNVVFVGLAAAGALRPIWAGLSMLISSLLAVGFAIVAGETRREPDTFDEAGVAAHGATAGWAPR